MTKFTQKRGGVANGMLLKMIGNDPLVCDTSPQLIKEVALKTCTSSNLGDFGKNNLPTLKYGG